MKSIGPEGSIQLTNKRNALSYRPDFKSWMKEHPKAMSEVIEVMNKVMRMPYAEDGTKELQDGDISVLQLKHHPFSDIFKVTVGSDSFFVKRDKLRSVADYAGGQAEYSDSALVKSQLGDDPDIEVIEYQLGYSERGTMTGVRYFVSKWQDLETVFKYLNRTDLTQDERDEINKKLEKAERLFRFFKDVHTKNMFYNPKTKKIVMFDIEENLNLG